MIVVGQHWHAVAVEQLVHDTGGPLLGLGKRILPSIILFVQHNKARKKSQDRILSLHSRVYVSCTTSTEPRINPPLLPPQRHIEPKGQGDAKGTAYCISYALNETCPQSATRMAGPRVHGLLHTPAAPGQVAGERQRTGRAIPGTVRRCTRPCRAHTAKNHRERTRQ